MSWINTMTNDLSSRFLGQGVAYDWDWESFVKITKQNEDSVNLVYRICS